MNVESSSPTWSGNNSSQNGNEHDLFISPTPPDNHSLVQSSDYSDHLNINIQEIQNSEVREESGSSSLSDSDVWDSEEWEDTVVVAFSQQTSWDNCSAMSIMTIGFLYIFCKGFYPNLLEGGQDKGLIFQPNLEMIPGFAAIMFGLLNVFISYNCSR